MASWSRMRSISKLRKYWARAQLRIKYVLMIQSIASLELVHTLYATANNNCKLVQSRLHQRVRVLQAPHPLRRQRLLHQPRRPKSPTCLSPRYCHQSSLPLSLSVCFTRGSVFLYRTRIIPNLLIHRSICVRVRCKLFFIFISHSCA
jgi:hypothetical protein